MALHTILELAESTGARVHLARLSTARGVALVAAAKARGLAVTCDVGVHHLHLCDRDVGRLQHATCTSCRRCAARPTATRCAARLADGTIDAVCSDHTPVDDDAKQVPFGEAEPGATGLELFLPLAPQVGRGDEAAARRHAGRGDLARRRASSGVEAGTLAPGSAADVCLFDPQRPWMVTREALASQGRNSPFLGLELAGRVVTTIVDGRIVYPG